MQALALMAQDESPRLAALGGTVLGQLLRMLHGAEGAPPLAPDVQLAVLSTVTSLSESYPAHRWVDAVLSPCHPRHAGHLAVLFASRHSPR